MANEEEILDQQQPEVAPEDKNLLEAYNELKENSISKKEYERVLKRNEDLTQALIKNDKLDKEDQEPKESNMAKIKRLTNELYSDKREDMTNLDYCQKTVELRDAIIAEGGRDPFLPTSGENKDSYANQQTADKVANGLRKMVEDANGSPEAFNSLYQARVEDVAVPKRNNYLRR